MSAAQRPFLCGACGRVSVRAPGAACALCGSETGALRPFSMHPDDLRREADRICRLWRSVGEQRQEAITHAAHWLVGKEVDVPFAPWSHWAVDPKLGHTAPPRVRRRMVLALTQRGQKVKEGAMTLTLAEAHALVVGIHPSRPFLWVPLPWLQNFPNP